MNRQIDSQDLPLGPLDETQTPSDIAAINAMHGMLMKRESPERATSLSMRSRRISSLIEGSLATRRDADEFATTERGGASTLLDAAVALLELSGHPHILGPETVALV